MVMCLYKNYLSVRFAISTPKGQTNKKTFRDDALKTRLQFQKLQMYMCGKLKAMWNLTLNGEQEHMHPTHSTSMPSKCVRVVDVLAIVYIARQPVNSRTLII
jgi:hypothetical protein